MVTPEVVAVQRFTSDIIQRVAELSGETREKVGDKLGALSLETLSQAALDLGTAAVRLGAALQFSPAPGLDPRGLEVFSQLARRTVESAGGNTAARSVEIDLVPLALGILFDRGIFKTRQGHEKSAPTVRLNDLIDLPIVVGAENERRTPADYFKAQSHSDASLLPGVSGGVLSEGGDSSAPAVKPTSIVARVRPAFTLMNELTENGHEALRRAISSKIPLVAVLAVFDSALNAVPEHTSPGARDSMDTEPQLRQLDIAVESVLAAQATHAAAMQSSLLVAVPRTAK